MMLVVWLITVSLIKTRLFFKGFYNNIYIFTKFSSIIIIYELLETFSKMTLIELKINYVNFSHFFREK